MLVTYVPRADRAGARIYANARAERIERRDGRVHGVHGRVVDRAGTRGRADRGRGAGRGARGGRVASPDLLLAQRPREPQRAGRPQPAPAPVGDGGRLLRRADPRLPRHSAELLRRRVHRPRARSAPRLRADADRRLPGPHGRQPARLRARPLPLACATSRTWRVCSCCCTTRAAAASRRAARRRSRASATRSTREDRAPARRGPRPLLRGPARGRRPRGAGALLERSARACDRGDDLSVDHAPRCARRARSGSPRRTRSRPAAWAAIRATSVVDAFGESHEVRRTLRRRHERLPDLARRAAADHDGGARRPHRAADPRAAGPSFRARGTVAARDLLGRGVGRDAGHPVQDVGLGDAVPTSSSPSTTGRQPIR